MVEQVRSLESRQEEYVNGTIAEGCSNLESGDQNNDYVTKKVVSSPVILEGQSRTSSISPIIAGHDEMAQDVLWPQSHPDRGSSLNDLANFLKMQCNQNRDMTDLDAVNLHRKMLPHRVRQQSFCRLHDA
jgi:hypothetical protein